MRELLITISIIIFYNIGINAQNVGIGTSDPQAKLHVKSDQGLVTAFYEGFNEGVINPAYQTGDRDWKIITDDPPVGTYGVGAPSNFLNNETAILEFTVNTPIGKDVRISFSASHNDPGGYIEFSVVKPGGIYWVDHEPSWKSYSTNFIATSSVSTIKFRVVSNQAIVNSNETWLDEISVTFASDPALMIDDGTQMSGGILQSDADGNASWVDLRGEIDQQILTATQNLSFDSDLNILNIENGNGERVTGLSNNQLKKLSLRNDTMISSPDMHFMIPSSQSSKSELNYNPDRGSFAWGSSPQSDTYVDAQNSVRWGKENKVYAEYASVWGQENLVQFTAKNGTVHGNNNIVGGFGSSAWGSNNTIQADSFGTVWGKNNIIMGKHSTAWGSNNAVEGEYSTAWGSNNTITSNSFAVGNNNSYRNEGKSLIMIGNDNEPYSNEAIMIGRGLESNSFQEVVVGLYNEKGGGNTANWWSENNLFSVGNGSSDLYRSTAFTVMASGNVGIGTVAPHNSLVINTISSGAKGITIGNTSTINTSGTIIKMLGVNQTHFFEGADKDDFFRIKHSTRDKKLRFASEEGTFMIFKSNGKIGISEADPAYDLHLGSNSAAKPSSSAWSVASDRRLKENIRPFDSGLALVQKINPVWFTYNGRAGMPKETSVGTIAQELERIAPYMVSDWEREGEKFKAVDYGAMDFILVNAIKELDQQNRDLRSEVDELKMIVQALLEMKEASTE
jgi:hypothetical protein